MLSIMTEYKPGVCNIGSAEIAKRKHAGWIGAGVTAILGLVIFWLRVPAVWRLSLFVPAFFAATGFLQGFMHFCAGFGMKGVFNFDQVGQTEKIEQEEYRTRDRRKAQQILACSALIGIVVALASFFFP
jgi:hypothetical protein